MNTLPMSPRELAERYMVTFGWQLRGRLATLSHRYPGVVAPNFLSWEGEQLTGADTTEKVRALYHATPWI